MLEQKKTKVSWEKYALDLAETAKMRSEDIHQQVGACVLRADHSIAALGYNGVPSGVEIDWLDREGRRKYVIHAECNALRYCLPSEKYSMIACTLFPCVDCMKQIASYGIKHVVFREVYKTDPAAFKTSSELARVFGISLTQLL